MPKITELFAFVAADTAPDDEGILAAMMPGIGTAPLVGADMDRVDGLRELADDIAQATGKSYRVLHFKLVGEVD